MKIYQLAVVGTCICAAAYSAETITVLHAHPLSALALELQKRYGYPVTYEEAPFDPSKLQADKRPNGTTYLSAPVISASFEAPGLVLGTAVPAALNRVPTGLPDVLLPLLADFHQADAATFTSLFEGGYAHIVPANRVVNGAVQPFQPILSTVVTMSVRDSSCSQALNSLLATVGSERGARIVEAIVPIGALMGRNCTLNVQNLPARDVLASILDQAGTAPGHPGPKALYSWALLHDPNTDRYFLSTSIVPDLTPEPVTAATPTPSPASGRTTPGGPSRLATPNR